MTGEEAWGSVVDEDGNCLLGTFDYLLKDMTLKVVTLPVGIRSIIVSKFSDATQQNNGAELLALVAALRITQEMDVTEIKCDSELLVKWWSVGHVNKDTRKKMDPRKLEYIEECASLRKSFEKRGGKLVKISGKDNLADLGYH